MLDRLSFVIGEAITALRRNSFMTFSAITTAMVALYLLGGLGYAYVNVAKVTRSVGSKFEMYVYLKQGTDTKTIGDTANAIRKLPGVGEVSWIPRDKAWALTKQEQPGITAGIDENPLPDSFKISLSDLSKGDAIEEGVRTIPAIDPNHIERFAKEERLVNEILKLIGWLSSAGVLLLLIAGILIFNTIRQAIFARRLEIRIMQLVGASRPMIAIPFLLEGLIHGAVGGSIAALFVWITNHAVDLRVQASLNTSLPHFPAAQVTGVLAAIGAVYGVICSGLALRFRNAG